MTFLVGQQGTGWTITAQSGAGNGQALAFQSGYTSVSGGALTMQNAYFYNPAASGGSITGVEVWVYAGTGTSGGGALIATSSLITTTSGNTGLLNAPISGVLSPSTVYTLILIPNNTTGVQQSAFNSGSATFANYQWNNGGGSMPFGAPPATLPAGQGVSPREFIIWIDGIIGSPTYPIESHIEF